MADRKPRTGYLIFTIEQRDEVKRNNPDLTPAGILRILADRWRALTPEEKARYNDEAARQNQQRAITYQETQQARTINLTGYQLFAGDVRPRIVRDNPQAKVTDVAHLIAAEWNNTPDATKHAYEEAAQNANFTRLDVRLYDEARGQYIDINHNFILRQDKRGDIIVIGYLDPNTNNIVGLTPDQRNIAIAMGLFIDEQLPIITPIVGPPRQNIVPAAVTPPPAPAAMTPPAMQRLQRTQAVGHIPTLQEAMQQMTTQQQGNTTTTTTTTNTLPPPAQPGVLPQITPVITGTAATTTRTPLAPTQLQFPIAVTPQTRVQAVPLATPTQTPVPTGMTPVQTPVGGRRRIPVATNVGGVNTVAVPTTPYVAPPAPVPVPVTPMGRQPAIPVLPGGTYVGPTPVFGGRQPAPPFPMTFPEPVRAFPPVTPGATAPTLKPGVIANQPPATLDDLRKFLSTARYDTYSIKDFPDERHAGRTTVRPKLHTYFAGNRGVGIYVFIIIAGDDNPEQYIAQQITDLGFQGMRATIDVMFNLYWYLVISDKPNTYKPEYAALVANLSMDELLGLLGPNYRGPRDRASLLFAATTGLSSHQPDITNTERYKEVSGYTIRQVWDLAYLVYNIYDDHDKILSYYPPYVHVALQQKDPLEGIVAAVTDDNLLDSMLQFGMIGQSLFNKWKQDKKQGLMKARVLYKSELPFYKYILVRSPDTPVMTVLRKGMDTNAINDKLKVYTLEEIKNNYEFKDSDLDRESIVADLQNIFSEDPKWTLNHEWCNNDETDNIMQLEKHKDVNKADIENPTLSFGYPGNYRCYQVDELLAGFRLDTENEIFHFFVPDFQAPDPKLNRPAMMDPTTGEALTKEFSLSSMKQLMDLLNKETKKNRNVYLQQLLTKVTEGVKYMQDATNRLKAQKNIFQKMTPEQQNMIRLYLVWVFVYSMWMRFWKGPGTPYPTAWQEGGGGAERCETGARDEHIFIQHSIRSRLVDQYEKDPAVKSWIDSLPVISYDFPTGESRIGKQSLTEILNFIQNGDFCMAHGSDIALQTAFYLISRFFDLPTIDDFNNFIANYMPTLFNIEKEVVDREIQVLTQKGVNKGDRWKTLQKRKTELARPVPVQPPFTYTKYETTQHTDPYHGHFEYEN